MKVEGMTVIVSIIIIVGVICLLMIDQSAKDGLVLGTEPANVSFALLGGEFLLNFVVMAAWSREIKKAAVVALLATALTLILAIAITME